MMENGWHITNVRVRYKDTDRMGVVYYGNYLTYFEIGRSEFMREIGFPYSELESRGDSLVVTEAALKYHSNVGYDSLVKVKTAITYLRKVRLRFDYEIVSEENRRLVTGHTVHACINSGLKPVRIPTDMIKIIEDKIKRKE
ncbi:acyl-CoA thioesterase [Deltaproteobacteria bacterium]|nr:acyl-CoA thioesterase [Deltaproteobacteria bacterium]